MPPVTVAVAVPLLLLQAVGVELAVTTGIFPLEVIVTVLVEVQPLESVIRTVHVVLAVRPVAVEVLCPLHH